MSGAEVVDSSMEDNDTCLQLALEGEKLCKAGNCSDGVAFFEAALQVSYLSYHMLCSKRKGLLFHALSLFRLAPMTFVL